VFDGAGDNESDLVPQLRAFQALERLVGWPTMLQALSSMRASGPSHWTEPALGETLSTMTGIDVRPLVEQCFSQGPDCSFASQEPAVEPKDDAVDAPRSKLGVRLALHWLGWLQNAMLSYTAVL
jgi:hypothetical protein